MKKTIALATLLGTLISAPAFAKTEGNYAGLDIIGSRSNFLSTKTSSGQKIKTNLNKIKRKNQVSAGLNYKYAVNFDNVFLAPGIFADYSHLNARDKNRDTWNIKYRYGAKLDLGYDITNQFAIYANAGVAASAFTVDWKSVHKKKSGTSVSPIYGGGLKYSATPNVDLNLGYDYTQVTMKDPNNNKNRFRVQTVRLGAAFKF